MSLIRGHILPYAVFIVIFIGIGGGNNAEGKFHELVIAPLHRVTDLFNLVACHNIGNHACELFGVAQTDGVSRIVCDGALICKHHYHFVARFGPSALQQLILRVKQLSVVYHFIEYVGVHVGRHHRVACEVAEKGRGVYFGYFF